MLTNLETLLRMSAIPEGQIQIYSFTFILASLCTALSATLVHEVGHQVVARHFGWPSRMLAFPAWRNPEERALRGSLGRLAIGGVDMGEALKTATDRQIRLAALAGPAAELTFIAVIAASLSVWVGSLHHQDCLNGSRGMFVSYALLYITIHVCSAFIANIMPWGRILNDGHLFFYPEASRSRLIARARRKSA